VIATLKPVYRFWSAKLSSHLYTISESEKNRLMTQYTSDVWAFEGIAFTRTPRAASRKGPNRCIASGRIGSAVTSTLSTRPRRAVPRQHRHVGLRSVVWYAFDEPDEIEDPETPSDSATVYALTAEATRPPS
jgi:hypothetical protein